MKQMLPLRNIEYNVPSPAESARSFSAGRKTTHQHPAHLLNVQIDFQSGQLQLDGNWNFIMESNHQSEKHWFGFHRERVRFAATLYPGQAIDLADATTGAAFAVEGMLSDKDGETEYSGLLLMDPSKDHQTPGTKCWNISLYLYNNESDDCEIRLRWAFYPSARFAELN